MDFLTTLAVLLLVGFILTRPISFKRICKGTGVALALILFLLVTATVATADDTVDAHSTMALCAAASGLVAAKQTGYVSKVIGDVGTNYRAWLVLEIMATGETNADEIADLLIHAMMRRIQSEYNSGSITWEELVDYSRGCAIAWEESH